MSYSRRTSHAIRAAPPVPSAQDYAPMAIPGIMVSHLRCATWAELGIQHLQRGMVHAAYIVLLIHPPGMGAVREPGTV